jgi:transcriptional regulator with XRE-family HTH domain
MEARMSLGRVVRELRESQNLSQEKLAEKTGISYQYLSAIENGRENFTIGILESLSLSLGSNLLDIVRRAYDLSEYPRINSDYLRQEVPLPPLLNITHIEMALNETHRIIHLLNSTLLAETKQSLSQIIQGNNYSGIVSNLLTKSFSDLTPYKNNSDQKYPDLICVDENQKTIDGLEIKSTIRPGKGGESHNGHSGWHLIACYESLPQTGDIRFIHVMIANLNGHSEPEPDWKYLGSRVNQSTGSQRTETYNTTSVGTTKLRDGSVYLDRTRINPRRWKQVREGTPPSYSLFADEHS